MLAFENLLLEFALLRFLLFVRFVKLEDAVDDVFEFDAILFAHCGLLALVLHRLVVRIFQQR